MQTKTNMEMNEAGFVARKLGDVGGLGGDEAGRGRGLEGWDKSGRRAMAGRRKQQLLGWRVDKQAG